MSLRLRLLLLGLATLVLPWGGLRYAREMEQALREGERQALLAMAQTLAASLQGRSDLLYRGTPGGTAGPYDLQPVLLASAPYLDGYADEWPRNASVARVFAHGDAALRVLAGVHERSLYLLIEMRGRRALFDAPEADPLDPAGLGDRLWLAFTDSAGAEHALFIATTGPGPVHARRIEPREYGRQVAIDEPRIEGAWEPMAGTVGYRIELRVPLSMLGARLGVLLDHREARGAAPQSFGSLDHDSLATRGRLIVAAPELTAYLAQFAQPGVRLTVDSLAGAPLAQSDELALPAEPEVERGLLARLYRRLLERPGERRLVEAVAPILDQDRSSGLGRVHVIESADRWLTLRDQALTRLLDFTLVVSALAFTLMFAFAARLAFRLARLQRASETALTREGLVTSFPETRAHDELGDVARSFATLLGRLGEYTGYLRTLTGKLAHEIRTPLTIVRSSLENLETEAPSPAARAYIARAREGSERLAAILVAMGAASRVEEAIGSAERSRFDLAAVVSSAVDAYRTAFRERRFALELPGEPLTIEGAPDLIVQMLDKLVDNAVDFSAEGATITIRLRADADTAELEVDNPGPPLAPHSAERLFESLWQSRPGRDSRPHFGLGLYIVRLIAEFHGGTAQAENLPGGSGARFKVRLARRPPGAASPGVPPP